MESTWRRQSDPRQRRTDSWLTQFETLDRASIRPAIRLASGTSTAKAPRARARYARLAEAGSRRFEHCGLGSNRDGGMGGGSEHRDPGGFRARCAPRPMRPSRPTSWRRSITGARRRLRRCRANTNLAARMKADRIRAMACFSREPNWRAFASSSSWGEGLSRGSISPRKSIWGGGWWPSRYRGPTATSPGFSRGSSMLISCRYTRSTTTRRAACAFLVHAVFRGSRPRPGAQGQRRARSHRARRRKPGQSPGPSQPQAPRIFRRTAHRIGPSRRLRPLRASQRSPDSQLVVLDVTRRSRRFRRVSRFRGLLFRLVGTAAAPPAPTDQPAPEREEPSRQFLREASAVQAAVWIVARLAEGLEHAHDRGLLHRDLKPSNILLAADGTPMLLDFNLAVENPAGSPEGEIHRAMVGGTLPYMSPEHIDAFNPRGTTSADAVDERSDIYALGLIFFELLAGAPPFPDPPAGAPLLEILDLMIACRRQPPSLRAVCPASPLEPRCPGGEVSSLLTRRADTPARPTWPKTSAAFSITCR